MNNRAPWKKPPVDAAATLAPRRILKRFGGAEAFAELFAGADPYGGFPKLGSHPDVTAAFGLTPPQEFETLGHTRYTARDFDPKLEQSLRRGGLTVLVGPPASGRSRSALEAAVRCFPERALVLPKSPSTLRRAVDLGWRPRQAVLWLGDLWPQATGGGFGPDQLALICPSGRSDVAAIGTLTTDRFEQWSGVETSGAELTFPGFGLLSELSSGNLVVQVPSRLSSAETAGAAAIAMHRASAPEVPESRNNLGQLMRLGDNLAAAEACFQEAAEAGLAPAMVDLGMLLADRFQATEAEIWFRRAAGHGDPKAMVGIGHLMGEECGAPWYRKAAELGDRLGMSCLGWLLLERGRDAEAEPWLFKAAELRDASAMNDLGRLWESRGEAGQAASWYRRAAELGADRATVCG